MSVSVLPRDSVGPPSLDYSQERPNSNPADSSEMEKETSHTEALMENLLKSLQGLNLEIPAKTKAAPMKVAMDDVDGLLGRGVDQDLTSYNSCSGSYLSPGSHTMSSTNYPSPASSGYTQSPQSYPQYSPRSQASPCTSMKSTGSSDHLCTGSPGSPSQPACTPGSSLSLSPRMPPASTAFALSNQTSTAPAPSFELGSAFNGFYDGVIFRENAPSLSSHSSSSNRSSSGSDDMNTRHQYVRGMSTLDDSGEGVLPGTTTFIGEQPLLVPDSHSIFGTFSSVPPPHSQYQPPQTLPDSQEMLKKEKIMAFLMSPSDTVQYQDIEEDKASPHVSWNVENLFWSPEQPQVVPTYGKDFPACSDFEQPQDPQYPKPQQAPSIPHRIPQVSVPQPQVPTCRQTVQSSQSAVQVQMMPGRPTRPPALPQLSKLTGSEPLPLSRISTSAPLGKRERGEEIPAPRKVPKLFNQHFEDPEDTDLHVLAVLTEREMEPQLDFIENFVSSCCQEQLDAYNLDRKTPLYIAVDNLNLRMVTLLLKNGARTDIMNSDKNRLANEQKIEQTPLHLACEKGRGDMVALLVRNGANVNSARFCDGRWTPLMVAVQKYTTDSRCRNDLEGIILFLIRSHADPSLTEKLNKKTALMMAVEMGEATLVQLMLEAIGAGKQARDLVNLPNGQGNTCLHIVAGRQNQTSQQRSALLEILVKFGGDNNAKNREGCTPNDLGGKAPMRMISSNIQYRMNANQPRATIPNLAHINDGM